MSNWPRSRDDAELRPVPAMPGRRCSGPTVRNVTDPVLRGFRPRAIRTFWTMTGFGAANRRRSHTPCATASATSNRLMPAGPRCRPLARASRATRKSTSSSPMCCSISGQDHDAALAAAGRGAVRGAMFRPVTGTTAWATRDHGAPNLTDAIWLYGGSAERLTETITYSRFGVMPAWSEEYRSAGGLTRRRSTRSRPMSTSLGGGE